jgi:hypothetical protein
MLGHVIIINVSIYGVDALLFSASGPIDHMSLPNIDLETLAELSKNVVLNQPINPSKTQRQRNIAYFLKPALQTIWNDILVHIFKKIHISLDNTAVLPQR